MKSIVAFACSKTETYTATWYADPMVSKFPSVFLELSNLKTYIAEPEIEPTGFWPFKSKRTPPRLMILYPNHFMYCYFETDQEMQTVVNALTNDTQNHHSEQPFMETE